MEKRKEIKYAFIIPLIVAGTLIGIPFLMYSRLSVSICLNLVLFPW